MIEITRSHSVVVKLDDDSTRNLHFNKIRPFTARVQHISLIFDEDSDFGDLNCVPNGKDSSGGNSCIPVIAKQAKHYKKYYYGRARIFK